MNIFVVDHNPTIAGTVLCDKHIVKMPLETAQLLCTAINHYGGSAAYKSTHINHPCSIWARETLGNWLWLFDHGIAICREYTRRYGKTHKSELVIRQCIEDMRDQSIALYNLTRTPHPQCMPDEYKHADTVTAYRQYYLGDKAYMATWKQNKPEWWNR